MKSDSNVAVKQEKERLLGLYLDLLLCLELEGKNPTVAQNRVIEEGQS